VHGVEEVHADHALGLRHGGGDLGDAERRGVGRDQRARHHVWCGGGQHFLLHRQVLGHGLHQQRGALGRLRQVGQRRQPGLGGSSRGGLDLAEPDTVVQDLRHGRQGLGRGGGVAVDQHGGEAGRGEGVGDAGAHQAGADDDDLVLRDAHG